MANEVYANGREIACKAGAGKTICATPDVCFTPPENPATPPGVPVPYPNTGSASDTTEGSKTVMISDKEVMLKHISYFKTLIGDEAGCAAKKGVITSKNKGKVYFEAWSMDVKFEGENIDRHLDLTTTNHASDPGDAPPWPYIDSQTPPPLTPEQEIKCAIQKCDKKSYDIRETKKGRHMPRRARCPALGSKKHKCVADSLKGMEAQGVRGEIPYPKNSVPGLKANRRPDIVIHTPPAAPPSQPCDVVDAKFPCSEPTKRRKRKHLKGPMESHAITGEDYMAGKPTAKEFKDYKRITGPGGSVRSLTPEDCKNEKCP